MAGDVAQKIEALARDWEAFKVANNERLAQIEKRGNADPLLTEKVEKINAALTEMKAQIDATQAAAQRRGIVAPGDAEEAKQAAYRKAFSAFARRGEERLDSEMRAALQVGVDTDGGYAVPKEVDKRIVELLQANSPMREYCNVISMSSEAYSVLVETGEVEVKWVGETEERGETEFIGLAELRPYFGEVAAEPHATQKMLDDASFDVEAWISRKLADRFSVSENAAFTVGNGVKKPKGILGYTMSEAGDSERPIDQVQVVKSGSSGKFDPDKLIDLVHSLHRAYRSSAVFMSSTLGVAELRKLKDGEGRYLWQQSFQAGVPSTLLGYPHVENDDVPDPAAEALALMFGDYKRAYTIVDVVGTRVLRDPYTRKPYIKFYTTKRFGGFLEDARAVKVMQLAA